MNTPGCRDSSEMNIPGSRNSPGGEYTEEPILPGSEYTEESILPGSEYTGESPLKSNYSSIIVLKLKLFLRMSHGTGRSCLTEKPKHKKSRKTIPLNFRQRCSTNPAQLIHCIKTCILCYKMSYNKESNTAKSMLHM